MTDEEKAEESYIKYRDKKCEITRNTNNHLHKDWRKSGIDRHKAYIDGYLDGITEGRKEKEELIGMFINVDLEKENAELKIDIEIADSQRQLAEKENEEMKVQNELLAKHITELQADKGRLIDENSLTRVLIDRCKELGIKDLYHLKDLLELAEVKKLEILELKAQIGEMKKNCLDVMRVQGNNLSDDYMAGMYNGMVVIYNSCFLDTVNELEKSYCSKKENGKWELAE